jgi:hypothetical protein
VIITQVREDPMSVLAQDAPRIDAAPTDARLLPAVLGVAVVALAVYLCVGVSWWFLPLSVLLIAGVWFRDDVRSPRRVGTPGFAELPMLVYAGRR